MTNETEVVDAEIEREIDVEKETRGRSMVVRPSATPAQLSETLTIEALLARRELVHEAMERAMKPDVHYGKIPGTDKPTLLKPGAEMLCSLFFFDPEYESDRIFHGDDHLTVASACTIFHAPTGVRIASGEGLCSTYEERYRWRTANRKCPVCGVEAIIRGKKEYGGGWLCFAKKGGCGYKWPDGSEQADAFENSETGRVENDRLADLWNTVVKMANKRALVAAVLNATGASDVFTQDVESAETEAATSGDSIRDRDVPRDPEPSPPRNWTEISKRLTAAIGGDEEAAKETAVVFVSQALTAAYGVAKTKDLSTDVRKIAAQRLAAATLAVEAVAIGDVPPSRAELQDAFASVFDGVVLDGPDWRLGPDEDADVPTYEEWVETQIESAS